VIYRALEVAVFILLVLLFLAALSPIRRQSQDHMSQAWADREARRKRDGRDQ
jgi:hypothetical protein